MQIPKNKPWRNKKHLSRVKQLPCCMCGVEPAGDAHHVTGVGLGGMGTKPSDALTMPLCREHHTMIHNTPELWPEQWKWVAETNARLLSE